MSLKALVVDDEVPSRSELRFLLHEAGGIEVIGEASSADEAAQLIAAIHYDVVFLDIQMPSHSGLQLAEELHRHRDRPALVFVTAHPEHALHAFGLGATDYLVKPVEAERLRSALQRLRPASASVEHLGRIPAERDGARVPLEVADVFCITTREERSCILTESEEYTSGVPMSELESRLSGQGFFRVHRRYLVDLTKVREVVPMCGGGLLLTMKDLMSTQVPVSRRRAPAVKRALGL